MRLRPNGLSSTTGQVIVNSLGNVGIGTDSPDYQLEVENTSSQATIGITGGLTDARLHLKTNNGNWMLQNDYSNNGALSFYNSGHRLVVAKDGNVGIGTTSPDEKLRVDGNIKSAGDFIGAALKLGFAGSANITTNDTNEDLLINPNGSGDILMQTTSTGNVGIGTTSPSAKLEVEGNILPASNVSYSLGSSTKSFLFTNTYAVSSAGALQILAGGTERMRITSLGNVGIGTTSPGAKLQIGSATYAPNANLGNNLLQIKSASGFAYLTIGNGDSANATSYIGGASGFIVLGSVTDAGVTSEHIRMTNTGNVGIGTASPSEKFEVVGNVKLPSNGALILNNANNNNQMYIRNGGSNAAAIQFGHGTVGGNIKMVLASDGKLGLGTTSPNSSSLLDVSSTTKGFLPPRMNTTQINAISSPAEGLTVYNTVLSTLCFFNGVSWQKVTSTAM